MIKALLRTFFILLILIAGLLAFVLTPTGLRIGVKIGSHFLPGKLRIGNVSGVIIGPITLHDVQYENKTQQIQFEKLRFNWEPLDLFKGRLHVSSLKINGLRITTINPIQKKWDIKTTAENVHSVMQFIQKSVLPFHLMMNEITLHDTVFLDPTQHTVVDFKKIFFRGEISQKKWDVALLADVVKPNPVTLAFTFAGKPSDYHFHLQLTAIHTQWDLLGSGNQNTLTVTTPHSAFLNGTLNAQLSMNMQNTKQWRGKLIAQHINLSLIDPHLTNQLSCQIVSNGHNQTPLSTHTTANLHIPAGHLNLIINYDHAWDIQMTVSSELQSHKNKLRHVKINLSGNLAQHILTGDFVFKKATMQFHLNGSLDKNNIWHGIVNQLTIAVPNRDAWNLSKNTEMTATKTSAQFTPFCLVSQQSGSACFQGNWNPQTVFANAQINLHNFNWLTAWLSRMPISGGKLQVHLTVSGESHEPNITGKIRFNQGNVMFPQLNTSLHDITATISSKKHLINYTLQAYSDKKPITIAGNIDLSKPNFETLMTIKADDVLVLNTDQYLAYVTANLKADINNKMISLTGDLTIPKGNIIPNDFKTISTLPSNDIVYLDVHQNAEKETWKWNVDINATLGKKIHINTSGIDADLYGKLHLIQSPGSELFATGQIYVSKGSYTVYGQTLTIEPKSYISYTNGLLDNPTLNLKATKVINDITSLGFVGGLTRSNLMVGIELRGTLKAIKITFFSNRASLSQADILSYLLLGYARNSSDAGNADLLLRALSAVKITSQGLMGKQNIASEIQSGLGLNELGVESETTVDALGNSLNQQSAFVVGKNITNNLEIRYSVNLLNPVNVVELRYLFNENWAIQTDSSTLGNGMDALYTISRN